MSDVPFGFEDEVKQQEAGSIEKVVIGDATLYRGNCLDVMALIEGVDHCLTDPPYEDRMHLDNRTTTGGEEYGITVEAHRFAAMDEVTRTAITKVIIEKCSGWVLYFCQAEGVHYWQRAIDDNGGKYRFTGIWVKPSSKPRLSGDCPGLGFETIVGGWCGQGHSKWNGGGQAGTWTANPEKRTDGNTHTSIKPQKLMRELVGQFTNRGQVILDTFMGSGSTGVAALALGRKFIGIERDPEYFDISCKRVEEIQKGDIGEEQYVKTKSRVSVALFEEEKPVKLVKVAKAIAPPKAVQPPKPRGAAIAPPAQKKRFGVPIIVSENASLKDEKPRPPIDPIFPEFRKMLDAADGKLMRFDADSFHDAPAPGAPTSVVGMDVECYKNFFLVCFTRFDTGKRIAFEKSDRCDLDIEGLSHIFNTERLCTFNGATYDAPMVQLALTGASLSELKAASDRIVNTGIKWWDVERELGIRLPKLDHIDLMEPNPAVRQSLKTLAGRLHARFMMDLPFKPESVLSHGQMNLVTLYCMYNDVDNTKLLWETMKEPLELRRALSNQYDIDLRSKSDAQVGEAIVKKKVEKLLNRRLRRIENIPSVAKYEVPPFIKFETPRMQEIARKLDASDFRVDAYGKVIMPEWLEGLQLTFGETTYSMGIGGLHSTEGTRALHSDSEHFLLDIDVSSQYPKIILLLGLFPAAIGKAFLAIYEDIINRRLGAKDKLKELKALLGDAAKKAGDLGMSELQAELIKAQVETEGGKIQVNGVFGKLGSIYSVLYAPHMLIATTLTGQLSLLMMIERADSVGIPVVSANTDGIVFRCPRSRAAELDGLIRWWEDCIGFEVEKTFYKSIYNSSVNSYVATKLALNAEDGTPLDRIVAPGSEMLAETGKFKLKGPHADPWSENSLREMMMKNPQMTVLTRAVTEFIKKGTPFLETVRACTDVRMFVTVINAKGGAKWREGYLARVVRYYWSTDGDPILYSTPGKKGTFKQVAKAEGAKPLMLMDGSLPDDIDYEKYAREAEELARDLGVIEQRGQLV